MGIVVLVIAFISIGISVLLLFKTFKWVFRKKVRVIWMFSLLVALMVGLVVNKLFFVKMQFIQSKVYPDLYLIKNPVEDRNVINKAVKEMVIQKIDDQGKRKNEAFKDMQTFTLRFYEYSKGDWGESGTAYFIAHKERRDGMTAELLEYYPEYLIAEYHQGPCKEKGSGYFGKLDYYKNRKQIKTDTLLNTCQP